MKTLTGYFAGITLVLCSVSACKKDITQPQEKMILVTVVEYKSNLPIYGAAVEYYTPCNCGFGGANLVLSKKTDKDGICEIPESIFDNVNYGVTISPLPGHPDPSIDYDHWSIGNAFIHTSERKYALPVVGDERLHLVRINSSTNGKSIEFFEEGELTTFGKLEIAAVNGLPADSSFIFYSFRGQTCKFTWNIYDSASNIIYSGGPLAIDIPKSGIQDVVINY